MHRKGVWKLACGEIKQYSVTRSSFNEKVECMLTFFGEGCYIWRGTISEPVTHKFHFYIFLNFMLIVQLDTKYFCRRTISQMLHNLKYFNILQLFFGVYFVVVKSLSRSFMNVYVVFSTWPLKQLTRKLRLIWLHVIVYLIDVSCTNVYM